MESNNVNNTYSYNQLLKGKLLHILLRRLERSEQS